MRDSEFASTLSHYVGQAQYAASLDPAGMVPTGQLGTGVTTTATFLRGDRTWSAVGTVRVGARVTMTPYTVSSLATVSHGLTVTPTNSWSYLQCSISEHGYSVGERVDHGNIDNNGVLTGWVVVQGATLTAIYTGSGTPYVVNKNALGAMVQVTAANWMVSAVSTVEG
jgi:hypothetical protein